MNKIVILLLTLVLTTNCKNKMNTNDKFSFIGEQKVLNNLKVNVKFNTDNESYFFTIYENGKKLDYHNENVRFYEVFIAYKNKLFAYTSFDDVERALGFEASKAEFYFKTINDAIYMSRSKMADELIIKNGIKLLPYKQCEVLNPNIEKNSFIKTELP